MHFHHLIISLLFLVLLPFSRADEPTRIVIECEDMNGVDQEQFGPGKKWQVGRWGYDLYQNMIFGGVWASRLRVAMTDAANLPAEAFSEIEVPAEGKYKVWVKYECPPFFNYAFGLRIESLETAKAVSVFDKTYGLLDSPKHFCFTKTLTQGSLYWNWGIDHDAAEGYEVPLKKGRHRVTLYKTANPEPAGARSVDAILITSDLSAISSPRMDRYPMLDELRRANHVYFRFRNPAGSPAPVRVTWNHWNHRYPDFYQPFYCELVRFYDAQGKAVDGPKTGQWTDPIAAGQSSPWLDLGVTMNTESSSPYIFTALPDGAPKDALSSPLAVDIALTPDESKVVKSFALEKGEGALTVLVQPDLQRREGIEFTRKMTDLYKEVADQLNREPRLGPIPKKLRLFAGTASPSFPWTTWDLGLRQEFRAALGLNTIYPPDPKEAPAALEWWKNRGGLVERSMAYHHTTDPAVIIKWVKEGKVEKQFHYVSYGDEIGLPAVDVKDAAKVQAFHEYLKKAGETPPSLGLSAWEQVKPLATFAGEVAVQIGVLPKEKEKDAGSLAGLKRLYWHSQKFAEAQGIASFAQKTREIRAALGDEVHTSANLGGMHPFYWMHQASFIESFKHNAMTLAWSEDYTYCMPEATRLIADFETAYLRKGASYHDTPMQFYCMPHWPGIPPEHLLQNAVLEWGQNVKDLDFFVASPDTWSTENYVTWRGGMPTWRAIRAISGMAGMIEDHLLPARTEPTRIALLLSESSDVWELEGKSQWDVKPGSVATNVSQEERKAIWYALRNAGYRVDLVTEEDLAEGLLKNYSVLYVCGQNLERRAAAALKDWAHSGGIVFATAGAARRDEADAPAQDLDAMFGRGKQTAYQRYKGPLRARLELPFEKPLDRLLLPEGKSIPVLCSREEFEPASGAKTLASYASGKPAWIENTHGKGRAYYTGLLPGQSYIQAGIPLTPMGKGGARKSPWMAEPLAFDATAAGMILTPVKQAGLEPDVSSNQRGVVTNRLKSPKSVLITVVNLAQDSQGDLKDVVLTVSGIGDVKRAWSCYHPKGSLPLKKSQGAVAVTLPSLASADVVVLE